MTLAQLAQELQVSRPTLNRYRAAGCPVDDLAAARVWVEAYRGSASGRGRGKVVASPTPGGVSLREQIQRAELRVKLAQAEARELELEQQRGNLVPAASAQAAIAEVLAPLRALLLAMPVATATKANPADPALAEAAIQDAVDGVFAAMERARDGTS